MKKELMEQFILKVPGEKLPKVIDFSALDGRTKNAILAAYRNSTIFAPNLTATKTQKLSAAMQKNLFEFQKILGTPTKDSDISSAFCAAFEFDSVNTPLCVHIIQFLAKHRHLEFIDINVLVNSYYTEYGKRITAADLYNEFQTWKYYQKIKACVGGVSIVKFMRFTLWIFSKR